MKYIAIDLIDKHVLGNKIFDNKISADNLAKEYRDQCVSFVLNEYGTVEIEDKDVRTCLKFGTFPYNNTLYYKKNED